MNNEKSKGSVTKLGINPGNKPSNTDPTSDTTSEGNDLKRVVQVGRKPEERQFPVGGTR